MNGSVDAWLWRKTYKGIAALGAALIIVLGAMALALGQASLSNKNGQQVETVSFVNVAVTPASFALHGGQYAVTVHATWGGGSLTLQRLAADGLTYVTCLTAFSADGYATVNLPPGTYQLTIATATAVYVDVTSVVVAS
jgi:hypothetical protein